MELTKTLADAGVGIPQILLPGPQVELARWPVVACDQYTSEPGYWEQAEALVGDAPSTLHLVYPEVYLEEGAPRIARIHQTMKRYLAEGFFQAPQAGFVLLRRTTQSGGRLGLVLMVDLEQYDFDPGQLPLIRPTEGTVRARIPPRVAIRSGGALELPHIMLLADDPMGTLIEPLYEARQAFRQCYDLELMLGGGHLTGWWIPCEALGGFAQAISAHNAGAQGLLFAVGDGNHSLAAARQCWLDLREGLSAAQQATHPARWAMAELVNLHDPALRFEPIHRLLTGIAPEAVASMWVKAATEAGFSPQEATPSAEAAVTMCWQGGRRDMACADPGAFVLPVLQDFLDRLLQQQPGAQLDYIHGEASLLRLSQQPGALGFLLQGMPKEHLFPQIRTGGLLPRKTFSMGEAYEKRYYMEARWIL